MSLAIWDLESHESGTRQHNLVDDVDHAIRSLDVSLDHIGSLDLNSCSGYHYRRSLPIHRGGLHVLHICSHHFAGNDVVGQNPDQLGFVLRFEQAFECPRQAEPQRLRLSVQIP